MTSTGIGHDATLGTFRVQSLRVGSMISVPQPHDVDIPATKDAVDLPVSATEESEKVRSESQVPTQDVLDVIA